MKRKFIYGTLTGVVIVLSMLYACKKDHENNPANPLSGAGDPLAASRLVGTKTYYSKNRGDTVYKMVLTGFPTGRVTVDRSIYVTDRPDTIQSLHFIEAGINYEEILSPEDNTKIDSVVVSLPADAPEPYYYIPFQPGSDTICLKPIGGPNSLTYSCDKRFCPPNTECILAPFYPSYFCGSTDCGDCWLIVRLPAGFPGTHLIRYKAGSVIIPATQLNVIN